MGKKITKNILFLIIFLHNLQIKTSNPEEIKPKKIDSSELTTQTKKNTVSYIAQELEFMVNNCRTIKNLEQLEQDHSRVLTAVNEAFCEKDLQISTLTTQLRSMTEKLEKNEEVNQRLEKAEQALKAGNETLLITKESYSRLKNAMCIFCLISCFCSGYIGYTFIGQSNSTNY